MGKRVENVRKKLRFGNGVIVEPEKLSEGLSLWWNEDVKVQMVASIKKLIDTFILLPRSNKGCMVFWVHGASIYENRKVVWETIKRKARYIKKAWMCIGDFNDILLYSEKQGERMEENRKVESFQDMVNTCQLNDVMYKGK